MIVTADRIMAAVRAAGGDIEDRPRRRPGRPRLNRICSIDWCTERHIARGFCARHRYSFQLYGDPLATSRVANPPEEKEAHMWPFCTRAYPTTVKQPVPIRVIGPI